MRGTYLISGTGAFGRDWDAATSFNYYGQCGGGRWCRLHNVRMLGIFLIKYRASIR